MGTEVQLSVPPITSDTQPLPTDTGPRVGASPDASDASAYAEWQAKMTMARGKAEVIIAKARNGPPGTVHVAFHARLMRFADLSTRTMGARYE